MNLAPLAGFVSVGLTMELTPGTLSRFGENEETPNEKTITVSENGVSLLDKRTLAAAGTVKVLQAVCV